MPRKTHNKGIFALCALFCACPLGGCAQKPPAGEDESYALFVYMSGADLETDSGAASGVIEELLQADIAENVSVYLQTGGAQHWHNSAIPAEGSVRWEVRDGALRKMETYEEANMGDVQTLSGFVSFAEGVAAEKKVMLFWGHGSPYGICPDERFSDDALTYAELERALQVSFFDLFIFNACYTASLDLMSYVSSYADYAIASEEVLPSLGFDYAAMLSLFGENGGRSTGEIGRQIIEDTVKKYTGSPLADTLTLSLIDLNALSGQADALAEYFGAISRPENAACWMRGAANANSVGTAGKDLLDLDRHYASEGGAAGSGALAGILAPVIAYETHGTRADTEGLYLYYRDRITQYDLSAYRENSAVSAYYSFLEHRSEYAEGEYLAFLYAGKGEDGTYWAELDERAPENAASFGYLVKNGAGETLKTDRHGLFPAFTAGSGHTRLTAGESALFAYSLGGFLLADCRIVGVQEEAAFTRRVYTAPVEVNGRGGYLQFAYTYPFDEGSPDGGESAGEYEILGFVQTDGGDTHFLEALSAGDRISAGGNSFVYGGENIKKAPLPQGCTLYFCATDLYGTVYESEGFPVS